MVSLLMCAYLLICLYVFYVDVAFNTNASVVCEIKVTYLLTYLRTKNMCVRVRIRVVNKNSRIMTCIFCTQFAFCETVLINEHRIA